jgi:hypothetical protein
MTITVESKVMPPNTACSRPLRAQDRRIYEITLCIAPRRQLNAKPLGRSSCSMLTNAAP